MNNEKSFLLLICFLLSNFLLVTRSVGQVNRYDYLNDGKDTVQLLYDSKNMRYVTSSVSHLDGNSIKNVPVSNIFNTLSGRITGIAQTNISGVPGYESSTQLVRGYHTFGNRRSPLILVNGRPEDSRAIDPYDIESVTVLKDAAATALYGLQAANGIILVTTKSAKEGKTTIDFNTETSFSKIGRVPKYLNSFNYAILYNEALLNDDPSASLRYNQETLDAYKDGTDPYRYPNVNWTEEFLRDNTIQTRNNLSVSGGNQNTKFYVSANYYHANGLYNVVEDLNTYSTNYSVNSLNLTGNLKTKIGNNLHVNADIRAKRDKKNAPVVGLSDHSFATSINTTLYSTPFNAHPILNEDGSIAGTSDYQNNPYGRLNGSGYTMVESFSLSTFVDAVYDLDVITKGLKIKGLIGFNNYNDYRTYRTKQFAVYQLNPADGSYEQIGQDTQTGNSGDYDYNYRNFQHYLSMLYSREFNDHSIDAFLMYERIQRDNLLSSDLYNNYQGPKGKFSYRYKDTYLLDLAFSYQGSEQFPDNKRYGLFPAVSAGWIISNENFLKDSNFINFLKLRGSYGITGNMPEVYFGYYPAYAGGTGYMFGVNPATKAGYTESKVANPLLTWEKNHVTNAGIDLTLLNNRLYITMDYFSEKNNDILIQNAISAMYGATLYTPEGKFKNRGYELSVGWNDKINDFDYYVNFNLSQAKNEIVYQDEILREHDWMYRTGLPYSTRFGYVFDRFFTEDDDIAALPDQSSLGRQQPGDLKYKDLNDDGVIDQYDITSIGDAKMPDIYYGLSLGVKYNSFDLNAFFEGTKGSTTYNSGYTYWDFYNRIGNVLEHHINRWTPGSGQTAGYPRLTLSNNNNYVTSSYWVQDNSFFRLKYLEVGYTLPESISRKVGMSKCRIFLNGNYVYTWDNVKFKDPDGPDNALDYPLRPSLSVGLNLSF